MTSFQDIQQALAPDLKLLNERIESALSSPNELMNRVVRSFLEKRGKQIRPIMVLLTAKLLGTVNDDVLAGAVAVELLHNASLIHDDVVDDTLTRRGNPTINGAWDNHLAVLMGDFFLSNALLQGVSVGKIEVVRSISNLGRLLSIGELDEIYTAHNSHLDENTYFEIIYRKTASLFVSCVEVGAYGVDVTDHRLDALREFARLLGLCFQIKDDVFDYFSDEKIGKPTGNDLREGKVTLPLLYALHHSGSAQAPAMMELARQSQLSPAEVDSLIAFAISEGGIDYAYDTMRRLRSQAAETLAIFPPSQWRDAMLTLFDFIISREL